LIEIPFASAFEFLKLAHNIKKDRSHTSQIEFYRGHSDKKWRLLPSVYRRYILSFEENLINEFTRRRPDQFQEGNGMFNNVAKMQHYGLHTRLLDVTENPAVALYFACCDNFNEDGEIFLFQRSLDEIPNIKVLNIITEFYVRHRGIGGQYDINSYYEFICKRHSEKDIELALDHILNGYYCFARPKIISERILRQSGSFMLFTNEVCPSEDCKSEKCIHMQTDKCMRSNVAKDLSKKIKTTKIKGSLHDYTEAHIKNEQDSYRYIIKAENKKNILSELQTIGINKAFLFPELNNEGIDIMEDYYSRIN